MKSKFTLALIVLLGINFQLFSQQFYYSAKTKNFLKEDTTILVFKFKDEKANATFTKDIDRNIFTKIDSSKTKGVFEVTLNVGVSKNEALELLRSNTEIIYAWHSLKAQHTVIIPTGEIMLLPKKGVQLEVILAKAKIQKGWALKKVDKYGVVTITVDPQELFSYSNSIYEGQLVEWCHPNFWLPIQHTTSDLYYGDQWYLRNTGQFSGTSGIDINVEGAWAITTGSSAIKVAVIDDGVENHDDFNGRVLSGFTPRNTSTGFGLPTSSGKHGVACAGIIAATQDNTIGIAGIAPNSYIVPVNIFYDRNETVGDLGDAINWAWDQGQADILSNSWGWTNSTYWL